MPSSAPAQARPAARQQTAFIAVLAVGAVIGGFLFGFDMSTMNSAINGIAPSLELSSFQTGLITSIAMFGAAAGAWFSGDVSERIGRTRVMTLAGTLMLAGSVLTQLADGFWLILVFRICTGLGIGAASAVVPAYVSEVSPPRIRGTMGAFWQMAIVLGQFLGLVSGYLLARAAGSESAQLWGMEAWRWMFAVVAVLALAYVLISLRLPQSPPDAVRLGDHDSARAFMERAGGDDIEARFERIREKLADRSESASLKDLRGSRLGLQGIVWAGILLAAFQQLVGINVVKMYSNTIWQSVGVPVDASFQVSMLTAGLSIAATVVAILIMDRVPRRSMLIVGGAFMVVSMAAMAIAFAQGGGAEDALPRGAALTALIGMNGFAISFGITWGPVMWLMLGELFDSDLRTVAVAVCTAVNWLMNWLITLTFPVLAGIGLDLAYGLYTAFALLGVCFVWKSLPETKGRAMA
ncbi:sugar porter family MFS transporter [Kocuria palustris]|uniref:sugar porter family MFS transporter n=1 Tax=Kocuria palustris TaxID=71999 RepID=UPI003D72064E